MKRYIHSDRNVDPTYSFAVYEVDSDGDEIDSLESFEDLNDAIDFATSYSEENDTFAHIVFVPDVDPDDDPDAAERYEYNSPFEPYEVVWDNIE